MNLLINLLIGHPILLSGLLATGGLAVLAFILIVATRYRGHHRGHVRSAADGHRPRHAKGALRPRPVPLYTPRHEVANGGAVVLGAGVDGDLTLVHAAPPAEPAVEVRPGDEPTVERRGLVTA